MRRIACMLLLCCGASGLACGQDSQPAPKSMPDPGRLFQMPQQPAQPQFKLQLPGNALESFVIPQLTAPLSRQPQPPGDSGILRRPHGFAQQQPRPAQPHAIYPDLKILPVEIAKVDPPANPASQPKFQTIPSIWPNAKIAPIPITWPKFRMAPVTAPTETKAPAK